MFNRTNQLLKDVYKQNDCSFTKENRIYPSGNIPGSYLGLSPQEQEMLLPEFIKAKDDPFNESN
jgi:hypothetical protein